MSTAVKTQGRFTSSDRRSEVAYYVYSPCETPPKAVIQLSHGMCEYVERYEAHAEFFCSQGFAFCGNDHLGHGRSIKDENDLGYTVSADVLVEDVAKMSDIIAERFPNTPIFLLGHSMGSFIARCYMSRFANKVSGVIISGTAGSGSPTGIAKLLAKAREKRFGDRYRDELLKGLSTGSYNKKFGKDAPESAWLTTNAAARERYNDDSLCGFTFTINGYYNLFDLLGRVSRKDWAKSVPKDLPVLIISGADDPVGSFGKGVEQVRRRLVSAGVADVSARLWQGARHELFNEVEKTRDEAYSTVADWITEHIK